MKKIILLMSIFLTASMAVLSAEPTVSRPKDGATVVFLGDSITDMGTYPAMLQLFYAFHGQNVTVLNAGVGGNTASMGIKRLNEDVIRRNPDLVFVMFGMNDVGRHTYKDDKQLKQREMFLTAYKKNMTDLVKKLKEANLQVVLMTPSPYGENYTSAKSPLDKGINSEGLTKCAAIVRELGQAENVPVIELHSIITALQDKNPDLALSGADRVHPQDLGALAIAAVIAQNLEGLDMVSSVSISKTNVISSSANATDVKYTDSGVSFTYHPENLPWPNNDSYQTLDKVMNLSGSINRELLIVKDLSSGDYNLSIKGNKLGLFSSESLAKGINIATLDTPEQQLALRLNLNLTSLRNRYRPATKLSGARQVIDENHNDKATAEAGFKKWIDSANNDKTKAYRKEMRDFFVKNVDQAATFDNAVRQVVQKILAETKVAPYEIVISK